ncbi:unnamed protein product [Eruca vesicaria subsp. sativa]|uniref:Uncharacterized protein n=1 Tax=Eruca vesicaria subsp. sativa TaxID=29727 RepID=A0ABC8KL88_ERUVS|nr:unnamed protein product [Eruca vesicaria subsp. sativa]
MTKSFVLVALLCICFLLHSPTVLLNGNATNFERSFETSGSKDMSKVQSNVVGKVHEDEPLRPPMYQVGRRSPWSMPSGQTWPRLFLLFQLQELSVLGV